MKSLLIRTVIILVLLLFTLFLTGCTTEKVVTQTKYEFYVPSKQVVPDAPDLQQYDTNYGLDHPKNFRKFQENQLATSDYIISLRSVISAYEIQIDEMTAKKREVESRENMN